MHFQNKIIVNLLIFISLLSQVGAVELEEIFVKERHIEETIPLDLSKYGNRVEIITADQIKERGFDDITQTIQMLAPGLFVAPKNGPFDYFKASMQGSRTEDILWLVDGVRITNRLYNTTTPLDTIPAHMVERIEILKGGQGLFYGTQAVSGVVNIVTKSFRQETDGAVNVGAHTNDGYNVNGYYRGATGNHEYVLYVSRDQADGFQPISDADTETSATDRERGYEVNNIGLKYAYNYSDDTRFMLHYQHTENKVDFAKPTDASAAFNERNEDLLSAKLDHQLTDNMSLFVKAYYHNWDSYWTEIHNDPANPGNFITIDDASFWGYEEYGVNAMAKIHIHDKVEYVVGYDHQSFSGRDDVLLISDRKERVNAVYFQARSTDDLFDNTSLALGVRHNEQSDAGGTTVWNISGKHDFNDAYYIQGNIGTSFRLPDAWQLFGVDSCCSKGNPKLKAEESFNVNLSVGGYFDNIADGINWELIGFHRIVDNLIGSANGIRVNSATEVKMIGTEFVASLNINPRWQSTIDYVYTDAEKDGLKEQIDDIPVHFVKWGLDYHSGSLPFGASLTVLYVGEIFSDVGGFFATGKSAEHGDYTVIDLSGFYFLDSNNKHRLGLRIENLLDEDYSTGDRRATRDSGGDYIYSNLGTPLTLHVNYIYAF